MDEGNKTPGEDSSGAGRPFGRYVLLEALDRGGMAEVYRAVNQGPGGFQRQFVIKRIRKEKAASREFVDMFVNEARISALLEHPNIVQVYDFGQVEGDYFLAMEYLRGRNLQAVTRRLRKNRREPSEDLIAYVGREVARGLHYAHTLSNQGEPLGIVHRDVSPSNIMLLRTGGVKLLDFGIARARMKLRTLTPIGGLIKGKLSYLSPEQVRGGTIDGRSDVFSLGIVLWEALTGLRLFFHPNDLDTMRNVLHRPVPKPSELRAGVSSAIDAVVSKALEREPEHRYADAAAMAADLEEHLREVRFSPESLVALLGEMFAGEDDARELRLPQGPGPARITSSSRPTMGTVSTSSLPPPIAPIIDNSDPAEAYATVSSIKRLSDIAAQHRRRRMLQLSALGGAAVGAAAIFVMTTLRSPSTRTALPRVVAAAAEPRASVSAVPEPRRRNGRGAAKSIAKAALPVIEATPGEKPLAEEAATKTVVLKPTTGESVRVTTAPSDTGPKNAGKLDDKLDSLGSGGPTFEKADDETGRAPKVAPAATAAATQARAQKALSIGLVALKKGEYLQAAARLEEAAAASPHSPEALVGLAEAEFELARYGQAANHARKAAAMAPKNLRSRSVLGDALFKLGRFRESAQVYTAAQALSPNDKSLRERRQRAEAMIGSSAEAPRE